MGKIEVVSIVTAIAALIFIISLEFAKLAV